MDNIERENHVDAVFGGKPVRFELYRDPQTVAALEAAVGSLRACWGRFLSDAYTMNDVRTMLALAYPAPPPLTGRIGDALARLSGARLAPAREPRGVPVDVIDGVLVMHPLETYAPLAAAVLGALLFGRLPGSGTFDEQAPGGFVEAA